MGEKVTAPGFGVEKLLVLFGGEGEVAVDFSAMEAQVKEPPRRLVGRGGQSFDSRGCQSRFRFSVSPRIVPTIRRLGRDFFEVVGVSCRLLRWRLGRK